MRLKDRWKQFHCLHYWCRGFPVDAIYGKGYKYAFHCTVCDKNIERWSVDEPISGIIRNPIFERKDPLYNASPPIIYTNEEL